MLELVPDEIDTDAASPKTPSVEHARFSVEMMRVLLAFGIEPQVSCDPTGEIVYGFKQPDLVKLVGKLQQILTRLC